MDEYTKDIFKRYNLRNFPRQKWLRWDFSSTEFKQQPVPRVQEVKQF